VVLSVDVKYPYQDLSVKYILYVPVLRVKIIKLYTNTKQDIGSNL